MNTLPQMMQAFGLLLMCLGHIQAADDFGWVPAEAKGGSSDNQSNQVNVVMPVLYTKIPKVTADRSKFTKQYEIDLKKFSISNDGTNPIETSKGINEALQFAKKSGKNLIIFPKGTYMIAQADPILFNLQDTIVDLNEATLAMEPTASGEGKIALIVYGTKNFRLTNGTMKGNLFTRPDVGKKSVGGGGSLGIESGEGLEIDHMNFTECTGFNVTSSKGMETLTELGYRGVSAKNLESGGFSDKGVAIPNDRLCRTIKPYDLRASATESGFDGEFEFGYVFGYGSYQSIFDRNYQACFYDTKMKFITKNSYLQYKKVPIPKGAQFIHLEFNQPSAKEAAGHGMVGSLSNLRAPVDVHFHHNRMFNTGTLGFAYCGGQRWIMEDNHFEKCGGNAAPHYGIDFEDGWDLMQDIVFRNNTFKDNLAGDLVICGGSEYVIEGNTFEKTAQVWSRTHNYTFKNNKFLGGNVNFKTRTGLVFAQDNHYENCTLTVTYERGPNSGNDGFFHEEGKVIATPVVTLKNETLVNVKSITGSYLNFEDSKIDNSALIAGESTGLIQLKNCELTKTSIHYEEKGPEVNVLINDCTGAPSEDGPGLKRKITNPDRQYLSATSVADEKSTKALKSRKTEK